MSHDGRMDDLPRCGGPKGKVIFTKAQARMELKAFQERYGKGKGRVYWCVWSDGAHYHFTSARRGRSK
jgi:hypothetical protein